MRKTRIEGDEAHALVEPGRTLREETQIKKRGRGRPPKGSTMVDAPYDPADLPLVKLIQERTFRIRRQRVKRELLYRLCDAMQVMGILIRRFQQEAIYIGRRLPIWEDELQQLVAAQVDCADGSGSAQGLLEAQWLEEERRMTHGYRSGNPSCGDPREDKAEKMRMFRYHQRRKLSKLKSMERPERTAFTPEEAALYVAREIEGLTLELRQEFDDYCSCTQQPKPKGYLERMRKLVGDLAALGVTEEMLMVDEAYECVLVLQEAKAKGIRLSGGRS